MSDVYVIEGGHALHGEIAVGGAKNSALKLLASSLLAPGRYVLGRIPRIADVRWMSEVIVHLGGDVSWTGPNELTVEVPDRVGTEAPYELVSRMRASTAVLGPLLAREGRARVAMPGGCDLGPRRMDLHFRGLEQLGARIDVTHGYIEAEAERLTGAVVELDYPSHGATENLLMAAVLAEGRTVIRNAARDPEITELVEFLQSMGGRITGAGTSVVEIEGTSGLTPTSFEVQPDRHEAGSYMFAIATVGGDVTLTGVDPSHLEIVVQKLRECGMTVEPGGDRIRVVSDGQPRPTDVSTLPYPGFPTDLQPFAVVLLTRADGLSIVTENIFDARFIYTDELARMGADVRVEGHYAVIRGGRPLTGAPVRAPDLRAGAALVFAGLVAEGRTVVEGVEEHIDRGYEDLSGRLRAVGANIERVPHSELVRA